MPIVLPIGPSHSHRDIGRQTYATDGALSIARTTSSCALSMQ